MCIRDRYMNIPQRLVVNAGQPSISNTNHTAMNLGNTNNGGNVAVTNTQHQTPANMADQDLHNAIHQSTSNQHHHPHQGDHHQIRYEEIDYCLKDEELQFPRDGDGHDDHHHMFTHYVSRFQLTSYRLKI
eukprot:TRINITY_DN274_c0_g1_i1.p6 TRINITY_DN274_c0_g1~~TRINITY_DN274_c0_g1_i1.p6  ORF type:complete len:130 (+),score=26.95 TRINITY_DN274_c0_g1_i1:78-467(+)